MANIYKSNYTGAQVDEAIGKVVNIDVQEKLTAGSNITISGNTISATVPTIPGISVATDKTSTATVTINATTKKGTLTAVTDTSASGHTITDTNTTFTIDLSNFASLSDISSAMVFKGTLGTGGTITSLPTASSSTVGDCYKVITAGTYNSISCTVGDMFICNDTPAWVHIPSGDDEYKGTVTSVATGQGLSGGTITTSGTIQHVDVTRTNNTSTAAPAHSGTFTCIDSITTNSMGHVTAVNTKTVTLPADNNTDTKVTQTAVTASDYTYWRPLVIGNSASATEGFTPTTTTDQVITVNSISCQPSTGTVRATIFKENGTVLSSKYAAKSHTHSVTAAGANSSTSITPSGTVSQPTFTGTAASHNHTFTGTQATASATYTPAGTVSQPTFTGTAHNHTFSGSSVTSGKPDTTNVTTVYSITGLGTLPSHTYTAPSLKGSVENQCLTLTFDAGTHTFTTGSLPTREAVSLPNTNHTHAVTAAGTVGSATAGGTVSQPTFTGTEATISHTFTPAGTISSTSITPAGTVSKPTFTGTAASHTHTFTGSAVNSATES